jgi:hypothetical protein
MAVVIKDLLEEHQTGDKAHDTFKNVPEHKTDVSQNNVK